MGLTQKGRWGIATILFAGLAVFYGAIFCLGFFMGIMGTDSCHGVDAYAIVYLVVVWPLTLLIAALTPSLLVILNRKTTTILVLGIVAGLVSLLAYLPYIPLLSAACRHVR